MSIEPELWRPVVGWEAQYEVSNRGRVRSLNRLVNAGNRNGSKRLNRIKGMVLKGTPDRDGYLKVNLRDGRGGVKTRVVHAQPPRATGWTPRSSAAWWVWPTPRR